MRAGVCAVTCTGSCPDSKAERRRAALGVCVVRVGSIERGSLVSRYRWIDGYSVVLDGHGTYPWLPLRQALAFANRVYDERRCRLTDDEQ